MVLSKGKKIILIAVAVVIILVAGGFALEAYSQTQSNINWAIRSLLYEGSASYDRDPYDPESVSAFIITPWNSVKDKSSFQRELADMLDSEILALTLQNAKAESSDRAEN